MPTKLQRAKAWLENPEQLKKSAQHAFSKADKNSDGAIDLVEAHQFILKIFKNSGVDIPTKSIKECFKEHADSKLLCDDGKTLNDEEWVRFLEAACKQVVYPQVAVEDKVTTVFRAMDIDDSGAVSEKELWAKLKADDEVEELLKKAGGISFQQIDFLDEDMDGSITLAEFRKAFKTPKELLVLPEAPAELYESSDEAVDAAAKAWDLTREQARSIKILFKKLDSDGDGTLSMIEAGKYSKKLEFLGPKFNEAAADGAINVQEFLRLKYGDPPGGWAAFTK